MDCRQVQDWLLDADDPRPERCAVPAVAEHLATCAACQACAADLIRLQEAWRGIPLPASADAARQAFLEQLPRPTLPFVRPKRRLRVLRQLVAAVLLLGLGLGAWALLAPREAHAAPAVIEELVDWNIELARAASPDERSHVYAAREGDLKQNVSRAPLPEADRALANLLLDNGTWLATHDDPIAAAERFSAVADKLAERLQAANARKEHKLAVSYAKLQGLVAEHGVADNLTRAEASGALNFEQRHRLENLILRDESRMKALVDLLEHNPNISRKEIRKVIDPKPKKPKKSPEPAKKPQPQPDGGPSQP
jgi:hypothetical protein